MSNTPGLDRQIADAETAIHKQESKITSVDAKGNEATDATKELSHLLRSLAGLLQTRMRAR